MDEVLLLGLGPEAPRCGAVLAAAGLPWNALDSPDQLLPHRQAEPAAAAVIRAGLAPDLRARWSEALRAGGGLFGSTPLVEWAGPETQPELPDLLAEWMGPLADRAFRNPAAADYRLVRLVGMRRARELLEGFGATLGDVLAEAAAGPVSRGTAHRLAGMAGLYGFAELGQLWLAFERGQAPDPAATLTVTAEVMATLKAWPALRFPLDGIGP